MISSGVINRRLIICTLFDEESVHKPSRVLRDTLPDCTVMSPNASLSAFASSSSAPLAYPQV